MRSQFELYKLQHNDKLPVIFQTTGTKLDSAGCWAAMVGQTDVNGATTGTDFGPYLQQTPTNPLNQGSDILVGTADYVYGNASGTTTAGWLMNRTTGRAQSWHSPADCAELSLVRRARVFLKSH